MNRHAKSTYIRRIFPPFALLLTLALFACGEKSGGDDGWSTAAETMSISASGVRYDIMRSDNGGDDAASAAVALKKALSANCGLDLEIKTDWYKKGTEPQIGEYEIIVGDADRSEAADALSMISDGEYIIRAYGSKLVIAGTNDYATKLAADYFIKNYVEGKQEVNIPSDFSYTGTYESMYLYELALGSGSDYYDESVTLFCLQGIFNRESGGKLYIDKAGTGTSEWKTIMSSEGEWLSEYGVTKLSDFNAYIELTRPHIKSVVIWDTDVPATVNLATTIAGVENAVPLTGAQYEKLKNYYEGLPVTDLRGKFDGSVTGSVKNDVYIWGIENYLAVARCSPDYLCYYVDSALARNGGDIAYTCVRDWATYNRAFVYDLSPWGDETPLDDPNQPLGRDLETYRLMLESQYKLTDGKQMTEVAGFFSFQKYSNIDGRRSSHEPVPTEWETVWLITPYNCFQNTATEFCYNQSFHTQYKMEPLTQNDIPAERELENKTYLAFLMADYDSSFPLYFYLPQYWNDPMRGKIPLTWGINPNLSEPYPDIISYFYKTRTANDYFSTDASASGYFNPSRIKEEHWDMVTAHNKRYYELLDLSLSPMILDWDKLTDLTKDNFMQFSPHGIASIVCDFHGNGGKSDKAHLWKGMPVDSLYNGFDVSSAEGGANSLKAGLRTTARQKNPQFMLVRAVWTSPTQVYESVERLRELCPNLDIEVVDMYTYFDLLKKSLS